jgi:anti-sigma regulatory factor (Ser/Thr protein kinase)
MSRVRREFSADKSAIPQVHEFVRATLDRYGVCGSKGDDIVLACDEAATNIVEHAFGDKPGLLSPRRSFVLALRCRKGRVIATFFDSGAPFDMNKVEAPDVRRNLAGEKRGGYGVFLMRRLVDKIVYSARRRLNVTRLVKEVSG